MHGGSSSVANAKPEYPTDRSGGYNNNKANNGLFVIMTQLNLEAGVGGWGVGSKIKSDTCKIFAGQDFPWVVFAFKVL